MDAQHINHKFFNYLATSSLNFLQSSLAVTPMEIPLKHQHHPAVSQQPHVSAYPQELGRCDANAEQIN